MHEQKKSIAFEESLRIYRERLTEITRGRAYDQSELPYDNHCVYFLRTTAEDVRDALLDTCNFQMRAYEDWRQGKYHLLHGDVLLLVREPNPKGEVEISLHVFYSETKREHFEERLVSTLEDILLAAQTNNLSIESPYKDGTYAGICAVYDPR